MEKNIVLTVFGLFSFGVVFIFGLTHSYDNSQSTVKAKINDKAILPCPVLQEVINKDGEFTYVKWYICPSEESCDGEDPPWNWTAGMNQQGGQKSTRKGTIISSDGSLYIKKVHLHDLTKYMCRVSRVEGKSPLVNYVTLTRNENGTDQPTNETMPTKVPPKTRDCKYNKVSDGASSRGTASYIAAIVVLAILLAVALGYIAYLKGLVPPCCKREARSNEPVQFSTLQRTAPQESTAQ